MKRKLMNIILIAASLFVVSCKHKSEQTENSMAIRSAEQSKSNRSTASIVAQKVSNPKLCTMLNSSEKTIYKMELAAYISEDPVYARLFRNYYALLNLKQEGVVFSIDEKKPNYYILKVILSLPNESIKNAASYVIEGKRFQLNEVDKPGDGAEGVVYYTTEEFKTFHRLIVPSVEGASNAAVSFKLTQTEVMNDDWGLSDYFAQLTTIVIPSELGKYKVPKCP